MEPSPLPQQLVSLIKFKIAYMCSSLLFVSAAPAAEEKKKEEKKPESEEEEDDDMGFGLFE